MHRLKRIPGEITFTISERISSGRILTALKIGLLPAASHFLSIPSVPYKELRDLLFKSSMHRLRRIPGESIFTISERILSGRILTAHKIGLLPAASHFLSIPYVPYS